MLSTFRILCLLLILASCTEKTPRQITIEPVAPGESFNAGFLIIDGVYNSELMAPYDIFQHTIFHTEGGIKVFTISKSRDTVTTFEGLKILPDFGFNDDFPEVDILVVPSAEHNMDSDLEDQELINFVKSVGSNADYQMSLCDGAFILAKAGLANNKVSTTFPSDIERYKSTFPDLDVRKDLTFVHDGTLLTSAGGAKSYDVALYLVHHLYGDQIAKNVGKGLVIDWNLNDYRYLRVDQ